MTGQSPFSHIPLNSLGVPAWVRENFDRERSNSAPPWGRYNGEYLHVSSAVEPSVLDRGSIGLLFKQANLVYLLDGPTYPVADGGSYVKSLFLEIMTRLGVRILGVAAAWPRDEPLAYAKRGIEVVWMSPTSYYDSRIAETLRFSESIDHLLVDSFESLLRISPSYPANRTILLMLDDYAHMEHVRGHPERAGFVHGHIQSAIDAGLTVLARSPADASRYRFPGGMGPFILQGIGAPAFALPTEPEGPAVIIGNFRYPPNLLGLNEMLRAWKPELQLRIVGDIDKGALESGLPEGCEAVGIVESLDAALAGCSIGIDAASAGSGISTKILVYASRALPIIATSFAARGLQPALRGCLHLVECAQDIPPRLTNLALATRGVRQAGYEARREVISNYDISAELSMFAAELGTR